MRLLPALCLLALASTHAAADDLAGHIVSPQQLDRVSGQQDLSDALETLAEEEEGFNALLKSGTKTHAATGGGIGFTQRSIANNRIDGSGTAATPSGTGNTSAAFGSGQINFNSVRQDVIHSYITPSHAR